MSVLIYSPYYYYKPYKDNRYYHDSQYDRPPYYPQQYHSHFSYYPEEIRHNDRVIGDVPAYDSTPDYNIFLAWVSALEEFFDYHNFTDDQCIFYASWKLIGPAKIFRKLVKREI